MHIPLVWLFATLWFWQSTAVTLPDLYEASVAELQAGLDAGLFTSVDLVKARSESTPHTDLPNDRILYQAYFARIEEVNLKGPQLRAVLELNPSALAQAAALDKERKLTGKRSPLHGIPILLKDNIGTLVSDGIVGGFCL